MGIVDRNRDYGDTRVMTDDDLADMPDDGVGEKVRWWFAVASTDWSSGGRSRSSSKTKSRIMG